MTEGEQSEAKSLADESLPGLTELLGFNERGELHEIDCGTVLEDKWELLELLGEGSFGKVYEARHVILGRRAAIKVLIGRQADPRARQRFLEEAQLLAGMQSNNLVRASDYGEGPGGVPYFVMDLVEGKSLRHWIRDGLTLEQVLMLGAHLLIGLLELHRLGVVHGDIKPENVVVSDDGQRAWLLDFGLATTFAAELTETGGTPQYMAPELLFEGAQPSVLTDIYAAGVVLYEMVTNRLPRGHLRMDLARVREEWTIRRRVDPVRMQRKEVTKEQRGVLESLDEMVMSALSPIPDSRPRLVSPMVDTLVELRGGLGRGDAERTPATRPQWVGILGAAALLAGLVGTSWALANDDDTASHPVDLRQEAEPAPSATRTPTPPIGMVYVPGGSFRRGTDDPRRYFDDCLESYGDDCSALTFDRERQYAGTTKVEAFFIDEYEVTNTQLAAFVTTLHREGSATLVPGLGLKSRGEPTERQLVSFSFSKGERFERSPYRGLAIEGNTVVPSDGMANRPAVLMTWDLASRYCQAHGKRLPTELEWEYAARGPDAPDFVWDSAPLTCRDVALGGVPPSPNSLSVECNERRRPDPIGTSKVDRTWCGVADMSANVSEWVADSFSDPRIGCPADVEPHDATEASLCHIYKGGNWVEPWHFARPAYRPVARPSSSYAAIGLRCAVSLSERQER